MRKLKTFDEIIGHKNLLSLLKRQVSEDIVSDVIIFHGNSGIGKSSIAKILAIEVVTRYNPELKDMYQKAVIEENKSTDSIKIFNMSEIQDKEEEIQKVKAELTIGFSQTKRKVLILDECLNMSKKAQDAILTELEYLQKGIYVFLCTTELGPLRAALKSRGVDISLNDLTSVEAKIVLENAIRAKGLTFEMSQQVITALICDWAGNQPRKMCKLLDSFKDGSVVSTRDLEVFINVSTAASIIELLKYLYGSLTLGIEYLDSVKYDESFVTMLIEVCKVALGHTSKSIAAKDTLYIKDFMQGKDVNGIIQFTAEVAGLSELRKRRVISAFMKAHPAFKSNTVPSKGLSMEAVARDRQALEDNVERNLIASDSLASVHIKSLGEYLSGADRVGE